MGSPFDAAARAADAVQKRVFGESVHITPMAERGRHDDAGADVTRQAADVIGVFTKAPDSVPLEGARRGGDPRGFTTFSGNETRLWLSAEVYRSLGCTLRKGDVIALTDRAGERWQIEKAGPATDVGDITLILAKESDAP